MPDYSPTNIELKKLLDKALVRFQNWKLEVERNPNPKMVHSLKNIVSIINSLSDFSNQKLTYSYKALSKQMAILLKTVADLNIIINDSLEDDDYIDENEEQNILNSLMSLMQAATDLIKIVQVGFGMKQQINMEIKTPALPESS